MNALAKFEKSTSTPLICQDLMEPIYGRVLLDEIPASLTADLKVKQSSTFDSLVITHPDYDHISACTIMLSAPIFVRVGRTTDVKMHASPSICLTTQRYLFAGAPQMIFATTIHDSSANNSQVCTYALLTPRGTSTDSLLTGIANDSPSNPALQALTSYESLNQPNWDGYDAQPITRATLDYARQLIGIMPQIFGPPDISPSGEGAITLEWIPGTGPLHKLFFDIGPGEQWRAYWKRRSGEFGRLPGVGITKDTKGILKQLFVDLSK